MRPEVYRGTGCPGKCWHKCGEPLGSWCCAQLPPSHFTASLKCPREAAAWPPSHSQGKVRGLRWGWQWPVSQLPRQSVGISPGLSPEAVQLKAGLQREAGSCRGWDSTQQAWGPLAWCPPDPPWTSGCMVCPASRVGPGGVCACPKNCHRAPFQLQVARLSAVVLAMPSAQHLLITFSS